MDKKLIFLDIDGTLVAALSAPSPKVCRAIRQARAKGHLAFLCTGRNLPIIGRDILDIGFDGVIASAGAYVSVGDQVLLDSLLPEEVVQDCLSVFHGQGMFCRIETPEGIYTDPQMEELLRDVSPDPQNSELIRMQKELESGLAIRKYEEYPRRGAYKLCFTSRDLESVGRAQAMLGDRFDFVVHPYGESTACFNGEIIPRGVDKGRGVELVCRRLGASPADAVAFGDSMNDLEMLQTAGCSVCMENGSPELKKHAGLICPPVGEDGLYQAFETLGLIS